MRPTKEIPCPDCYGGHFRPCQMCSDTGRATLVVEANPPENPDGSVAEPDTYQSEEYNRFVEESANHCECRAPYPRPCDGVLAGGLCDGRGLEPDFTMDDLEWSEEFE